MLAPSAKTVKAGGISAVLLFGGLLGLPAQAAPQYTLVDLGTFGGPTSRAFAINISGQVAGYAEDSTGRRHAFRSARRNREPALTDFASPEESGSVALAINSRGQITGARELGTQAAIAEADRWRDILGLPPRSSLNINAAPPLPDVFSSQGFRSQAYLRTARVKYFPPRRMDSSQTGTYLLFAEVGQGIDRQGVIVGGRQIPREISSSTTIFSEHAFRTNSGSFVPPRGRDLGDLSSQASTARGINDRRQVVGTFTLPGSLVQHAFRSPPRPRPFKTEDLGTLGGQNSEGRAINSRGMVTGEAETADASRHAFRSAGNFGAQQLADLGTLSGKNSVGYAINSHGDVVGSSDVTTSSDTHGFIYDDSGMHDLNGLIPAAQGWVVTDAVGINFRGEIAANGTDSAGRKHALLLRPIEAEPAAQ